MKKLGLSRNICTLFVAMIFGNASERIIFPIFALVFFDAHSHLVHEEATHAVRSYWYGICMATPSIATFIAAPLLSCLSDYFGRRKILIVCLCGMMVSGIVTSIAILSSSIYLFIVGVFILGLFCRTNPLAQAVIGDVTEGKDKLTYIGYIQSMIAFGAFLGPIIGGYCAHVYFDRLNFAAPFILAALLSAIGLAVLIFLFKETLINRQQQLSLNLMFGSVVLLKKTWKIAAILACGQFSWSFYYQYAPAALRLTGEFSASAIGIFVGLMALWVTLGSTLGIRFLRQYFSLEKCLTIGLLLQSIGGILIVIALSLDYSPLIWASAIPAASGDVLTFSVLSTIYSNRYPQQQGQAMGACYLVAAMVWILTGLFGGYLLALSNNLPLFVGVLGAILAVCLITKQSLKIILSNSYH